MTYIILKQNKSIIGYKTPPNYSKVCTLKYLFPTNSFLIDQYKLKGSDKISVRHTKRIKNSKFHKKGYRTKFKHVFNGTVEDFNIYCTKWYKKNIWKKNNGKKKEIQDQGKKDQVATLQDM